MPKHPTEGNEAMRVELTGKMKHSRLHSRGFNWKMATERALQKQYYRAWVLSQTNKDYQVKYPNECTQNNTGKCHPEAAKRILKEHETILKHSMVPVVERPTRLSKVG